MQLQVAGVAFLQGCALATLRVQCKARSRLLACFSVGLQGKQSAPNCPAHFTGTNVPPTSTNPLRPSPLFLVGDIALWFVT